MEGLGMLRKPLEASGRLWKVGAELPGARKGEQKLAEPGRSWPGLEGACSDIRRLVGAGQVWQESTGAGKLATAGRGLQGLATAGRGWQSLAGAAGAGRR